MTTNQSQTAVDRLRLDGYEGATTDVVDAIADRFPWLKRRPSGWQMLCRLYVEHPEWR